MGKVREEGRGRMEEWRVAWDTTEGEYLRHCDLQLRMDQYASFNDFFARRLRPDARPIASLNDLSIVIQAQLSWCICLTSGFCFFPIESRSMDGDLHLRSQALVTIV